jgi:hypothetical protein
LLEWPRDQWLDNLTRLLLALSGGPTLPTQPAAPVDLAAMQLAELLAASRYAVFVWAEDEFAAEGDRLLVERLHEIAARLTATTRCSLLPLGVDPGRTTAKETLLWLTNHATTARFQSGRWCKPQVGSHVGLDDWHGEHDWILGLRTLPSDRPLPDLPFDLVLDAACNQRMHSLGQTPSPGAADVIGVAAVGLECPGHVTRVDHAFGAYLPALLAANSDRPSASQVIAQLCRGYETAGGNRC